MGNLEEARLHNPEWCKLQGECRLRHICVAAQRQYGPGSVVNRSYLRGESVERTETKLVYVIKQGLTIVHLVADNGDPLLCVLLGQGDTLGETGAYMHDASDYFYAATDLEVCGIPASVFKAAISSDERLLADVVVSSTCHLSNFACQIWILEGTRIRDKIERLFAYCFARFSSDDTGNFAVPLTHENVSVIVHAERSSVSRALKKMEDQGFILIRPNSILLKSDYLSKDPSFLRQLETLRGQLNLNGDLLQ